MYCLVVPQTQDEDDIVEYDRIPKMDTSQGVSAKPLSKAQTQKHKEADQLSHQYMRHENDEQMECNRRASSRAIYDDSGDEYEHHKHGRKNDLDALKALSVQPGRSRKTVQEVEYESIRLRH